MNMGMFFWRLCNMGLQVWWIKVFTSKNNLFTMYVDFPKTIWMIKFYLIIIFFDQLVKKTWQLMKGQWKVSQPHFWKSVRMTFTFLKWESSATQESYRTFEISEFDCRGQNTSNWAILYIIGKLLKFRCWKWACMGHLDICNISYGKKERSGVKLKVENRDPNVCRWSAIHRWKVLKERYKFASDLIPIGSLSKELWSREVLGV
jgi:hypothetical protein